MLLQHILSSVLLATTMWYPSEDQNLRHRVSQSASNNHLDSDDERKISSKEIAQIMTLSQQLNAPFTPDSSAKLHGGVFGNDRAKRVTDVVVFNASPYKFRFTKKDCDTGMFTESLLPPSEIPAQSSIVYGTESDGAGVTGCFVLYEGTASFMITTSNAKVGSNHGDVLMQHNVKITYEVDSGNRNRARFIIKPDTKSGSSRKVFFSGPEHQKNKEPEELNTKKLSGQELKELLNLAQQHKAPFTEDAEMKLHAGVFGNNRAQRVTDVALFNSSPNKFKFVRKDCDTGLYTESLLPPAEIPENSSVVYGTESNGAGVTGCYVYYQSEDKSASFMISTSNAFMGSNKAEVMSQQSVNVNIDNIGKGNQNRVRFVIKPSS